MIWNETGFAYIHICPFVLPFMSFRRQNLGLLFYRNMFSKTLIFDGSNRSNDVLVLAKRKSRAECKGGYHHTFLRAAAGRRLYCNCVR